MYYNPGDVPPKATFKNFKQWRKIMRQLYPVFNWWEIIKARYRVWRKIVRTEKFETKLGNSGYRHFGPTQLMDIPPHSFTPRVFNEAGKRISVADQEKAHKL